MSILIFAVVVIVILLILAWVAVDFLPGDPRLKGVLKALAVLVAVVAIADKAGMI